MGDILDYVEVPSEHVSEVDLESLEILWFYHDQYEFEVGEEEVLQEYGGVEIIAGGWFFNCVEIGF